MSVWKRNIQREQHHTPPPKPEEMPPDKYHWGDPLFHGSSRDIEGAVLPNKVHNQGRANADHDEVPLWKGTDVWVTAKRLDYDGWLRHHKAYATENEEMAWGTYAHRTADRGGGRGRVYEVDPHPSMGPGAFNHEVTADRFDVKGRLDIKPGHQGTFPIDWRPYANPRDLHYGPAGDQFYNHPSPDDQESMDRTRATQERMQNPPEHHQETPGQRGLWGDDVPLSSHQFAMTIQRRNQFAPSTWPHGWRNDGVMPKIQGTDKHKSSGVMDNGGV